MAENWVEDLLYADLVDGISHGIRVSNLTYLTAKKLNLDEETCYNLAVAGMVHDIGKLRLSAYLYGRNSKGMIIEEMQYMRMHSNLSHDILKEHDFSPYILETVLYHHENYDGSGYPENLKADKIPLGARIVRVADAFVALISERPYREAFDVETAMNMMIEDIKEYDMQVFLAFQKVMNDDGVMELIQRDTLLIDINLEEII